MSDERRAKILVVDDVPEKLHKCTKCALRISNRAI
jgi:hypothetical protein